MLVYFKAAVGKTSIITRYINGQFSEHYNVTVGVEYASKIVQVEHDKFVRLQIWDTAGQQLFKAVVRTFYKGISTVFLVYSINCHKSFLELRNWVEEAKEQAHQEVVIILLGTKCDLQDQRQVTVEEARTFMQQIEAIFFLQISAKTGTHIQELFNKTSATLYKKYMTNNTFKELVHPTTASGFSTASVDGSTHGLQPLPLRQSKHRKHCCH